MPNPIEPPGGGNGVPGSQPLGYADSTLRVEIDRHSRDCESAYRLARVLGFAGISVPIIMVVAAVAGMITVSRAWRTNN